LPSHDTNALDYATEEVLSTKYENGRWRLVAFISKPLNTTEQNYEIHNKEMLAVIRHLEVWRHYLKGIKQKSLVFYDKSKVKSKASKIGSICHDLVK